MEKQDIAVISIVFSNTLYGNLNKSFLGDESAQANITEALTEWLKYLKETFIDKLKSEDASDFYLYLRKMINDHYEKRKTLDGLAEYVSRVRQKVRNITNKG